MQLFSRSTRLAHFCSAPNSKFQQNIAEFFANVLEIFANFKKISGILCDLNGTIHIGTKEIEGSIAALAKLRETGIRIHFLSNTTKESKTSLLNKLKAIGFPIESNVTEMFYQQMKNSFL